MFNNKGITFRSIKTTRKAVEYFDKTIKKKSWSFTFSKDKSFKTLVLQKYDEDMKCYDKIIELDPDNSDVYHNKGFY